MRCSAGKSMVRSMGLASWLPASCTTSFCNASPLTLISWNGSCSRPYQDQNISCHLHGICSSHAVSYTHLTASLCHDYRHDRLGFLQQYRSFSSLRIPEGLVLHGRRTFCQHLYACLLYTSFTPIDITEAMFSHFSSTKSEEANSVGVRMRVVIDGEPFNLEAEGNGRLDAVSNALKKTQYHFDYKFITYSEHAIGSDSNSKACLLYTSCEYSTTLAVQSQRDIRFAEIFSQFHSIYIYAA